MTALANANANANANAGPGIAALRGGVAALGARFDESVLAATRSLYEPAVPAEVPGVVVAEDLAYGPAPRHRLDLHGPAGANRAPVVVFVHGGGFVAGDKRGTGRFYRNVGLFFARHGWLAATINYRLAPDAPWPAGTEDVAAAVAWLRDHAAAHGGDAQRLALVGQSAGACHVAGYLFDPAHRAASAAAVRAAVLMSGFYAARAPLSAGQRAYFGEDERAHAARSPLTHAEAGCDLPLLLTLAEFDPAPLALQTLELAAALTRARGRCPALAWQAGHNHVSTVMSLGSAQAEVGHGLLDFLGAACGTASHPIDNKDH